MNKMKEIRVAKVTVNIGCGEAGDKLDKAKRLLHIITDKKICSTKTKKRTTFGSTKGREIGCKVTLRGKHAEEFLKRVLDAIENKLKGRSFDSQGNFSFGIKEHIDIPGVRYDPDIGIYGMDICVTLERRGFRVQRKRIKDKISHNHLIKPDESRVWAEKNLGVKIV